MKTTLLVLSIAALLAAIAGFWLFTADSMRLHGNASHGSHADGRYWVSDHHGTETEASEEDWRRNDTLGIVMFSTFPLGMPGFAYLLLAVVLPRFIYRAPADERDARVREVEASGPVLGATKCTARFRWFAMGNTVVTAKVYPRGLVLCSWGVGSVAIRADEIQSVRKKWQLLENVLVIEHASSHVVSPIRLGATRCPKFAAALRVLAEQRDDRSSHTRPAS